jgi:diacylglycerol kinase (ATP)
MKYAKLVHNPTAGEAEHTAEDLLALIEKAGYTCSYSSTKEDGWDKLKEDMDVIIVAGGDGTVRKIADRLLHRRRIDKPFPIALLPYGTANNIAATLNLDKKPDEIIANWDLKNRKPFDIGKIYGLKKASFFLESFGFGVFPELIHTMREHDDLIDSPEEKIEKALKELSKIVETYPGRHTRLIIDGEEMEGNYLLCEIMNTRSVGPNLVLSPAADPGDGEFEVVLVGDDQRDLLAAYVENKLKGNEREISLAVRKGKNLTIHRDGSLFHSDDELFETKRPKEIRIELFASALEFLKLES